MCVEASVGARFVRSIWDLKRAKLVPFFPTGVRLDKRIVERGHWNGCFVSGGLENRLLRSCREAALGCGQFDLRPHHTVFRYSRWIMAFDITKIPVHEFGNLFDQKARLDIGRIGDISLNHLLRRGDNVS